MSLGDIQAFHDRSRRLDGWERRILAGAFERRINATGNSVRKKYKSLVNPSNNSQLVLVENVDAQTFHDIFEIVQKYLPNGDAVDVRPVADYQNTKNYLTSDGMAGFAMTEEGDLISVFNLGSPGFLKTIKPILDQYGVKTLDCFQSSRQPLASIYQKVLGFKTASILDFNYDMLASERGKDYADWFVKTYGEAPVHFMVKNEEDVEIQHFDKSQYDEAKAYQMSFNNLSSFL